eukprot:m.197180 g.197180  ORF g.197180 m.197180 type:complete len:219 (+) comp18710_c0_seq7:352-1008(+)
MRLKDPQFLVVAVGIGLLWIVFFVHSSIYSSSSKLYKPNEEAWRKMKREFKKPVPAQVPFNSNDLYKIYAKDIDGKLTKFKQFKEKVILIVNVASHDVKTKAHFTQLNQLYDQMHHHGLEIVVFPCNQFGSKEAGTNLEIKHFLEETFKPKFHIMGKVDVNGPKTAPIYRFLKTSFPGTIRWNFSAYFVIDKKGNVVRRSRLMPLQLQSLLLDLLQEQ